MRAIPMLMRSWWILALRGAIAVIFGIFALTMPGATLISLIALFAVYALLAGAVSLIGAIRNRETANDWWLLLLTGLASLGAGVLATLHPALTLLALVMVIGLNTLITGVLDVFLAITLRKQVRGEWILIAGAATSMVFGVLIIAYPGVGAVTLLLMVGVYALIIGALYLALANRAYQRTALANVGKPGAGKQLEERRTVERRISPAIRDAVGAGRQQGGRACR